MRTWLSLRARGRIWPGVLPSGKMQACRGLRVRRCLRRWHPGRRVLPGARPLSPPSAPPSFQWRAQAHLPASAPRLILETPTQPLPFRRPSRSPVLRQPCPHSSASQPGPPRSPIYCCPTQQQPAPLGTQGPAHSACTPSLRLCPGPPPAEALAGARDETRPALQGLTVSGGGRADGRHEDTDNSLHKVRATTKD